MEIRPEGKIDLSQIDDDTIVLNESLLAKNNKHFAMDQCAT